MIIFSDLITSEAGAKPCFQPKLVSGVKRRADWPQPALQAIAHGYSASAR